MATKDRQSRTVETPTEARQAELGPSVLAMLTVSTVVAVLILGIVWFVFFRTWQADTTAGAISMPHRRPIVLGGTFRIVVIASLVLALWRLARTQSCKSTKGTLQKNEEKP
jgi:biotin transporter BioY